MITIIKNQSGSTIFIALMLIFMLTMLGIMVVSSSNTEIDLSFNSQHSDKSFYAAEAGAKRAYTEILADDAWDDGYSRESFNNGYYSVNIVDSLDDSTLTDTILIQSTGYFQKSRTTVELSIIPEYLKPFTYAMFAGTSIFQDKNTCTDSFNSDSGSYAATQLDSMGNVGSNGTIGTSKDVNFGGSVETATPGGITLGVNNTVNGDTTSTADSVVLDIIPQSEYDWAKANSDAISGISGSNFSYNQGTRTLTTGSYADITLHGGVYYFTDISLDQYSKIHIPAGENVTIYVTGDINLGQGTEINNGGLPTNLQIWSQGSLNFNQGNVFYGSFYGPNGHIQYDQTSEVYGAIVGNTIKLDQGACFHYDRSLGSMTKGTTGNFFMVAWSQD